MTAAVFTGPIDTPVTTTDGTRYHTDGDLLPVADNHAAEVAHLVALHHLATGRLTGYQPAPQFTNYTPHTDNEGI